MDIKEIKSFKQAVKQSASIRLPKFVKFIGLKKDMSIILEFPLENRSRMLASVISSWAKTFDYEEYSSGTGGDGYRMVLGPSTKLVNARNSKIKQAIVDALDYIEYDYDAFENVVKFLQKKGFIEPDAYADFKLKLPR